MRHTLIIRHIGKAPDRFQVTRLEDGKGSPSPAEILSPDGFPLEGRQRRDDVRWRRRLKKTLGKVGCGAFSGKHATVRARTPLNTSQARGSVSE